MTGEGLILYYNRLNGNSARLETLKRFHAQVQNFLDSQGTGPMVKQLKGIYERLTSAIKSASRAGVDYIERIELTPIKVKEPLKKAAKTNPVPRKPARRKKAPTPEPVEELMLEGLECIQDDTDLDEGNLDGIGDTTYKVITDKIMELMASDGLVWRKPWNKTSAGDPNGLAHNHVTKHRYRGVNFYLNYLSVKQYTSLKYLTFKQVKSLGGTVREGEKSWPVVYFKWVYKNTSTNKLVDEAEATESGRLKKGYEKIPALLYYRVFNVEQCEGLNIKEPKPKKKTDKEIIESAEAILDEMPKRPKIKSGNEALYRPSEDQVQLVPIGQFKREQEYYSVAFHELIHSTGHESRIGRPLGNRFGTKPYAFEELIAELGASYLCGESGILYFTLKNSAAYIQGWSKRLKEEMTADPKFFLKAASAAQKAADFMLARGEFHDLKKLKAKKVKSKAETEPEKKSEPAMAMAGLHGFTTADQGPEKLDNVFTLQGEIGKFIGEQQRYRCQIVIDGEKSSSKSELVKQLADAFIEAGFNTALVDYEMGGLASKDTRAGIERNVRPENRKKLFVSPSDFPATLESIRGIAGAFDCILVDSGSKLEQATNAWLDELRVDYPELVTVVLMHQNTRGGTKGGTAAGYNAPVVIKTYRPDPTDPLKNYAWVEKNRGNATDKWYVIAEKKVVDRNPEEVSEDQKQVA